MTKCAACKFWRRKPPARAAAKITKGDCRAPDNHRYWHHTMADGTAALGFGCSRFLPT